MKTSAFINKEHREFSFYVNATRVFPHGGDGLRVGQRIALYLLRSEPRKLKAMALAGSMLKSTLYKHGDESAMDSINRLAAPYLNNIPLIEPVSDSGFGSRVAPTDIGDGRYTEVDNTVFAEKVLFVDIEDMPMRKVATGADMPISFLPLVPTALLNGVSGSGVGFAVNILPRRLEDLIRAVQNVLAGKPAGKLLPGWYRYDVDVKKTSEPGRYELLGKFHREGSGRVIVTELPPNLVVADFRSHLINLIEANKIVDFIDHSTDKIQIEIKMSRNALMDLNDDQLVDLLRIRTYENEVIRVLDWKDPENHFITYEAPQQLVEDFVQWRLTWYEQRYKRLLAAEQRTLLRLASILACFDADLPKALPKTRNKAALVSLIKAAIEKKRLDVDSDIVESIATMPTYRWTIDEEEQVRAKYTESLSKITDYKDILAKPERRRTIFGDELRAIDVKKYMPGATMSGRTRRTS